MNITKVNGIGLAWESFGDPDGDAILLIAGLGTQMIRWSSPFCEELAALGYRVIRFDNRDAGCSTHLDACPPPDFGALASAVQAGANRRCRTRCSTWRVTRSDCSTRWKSSKRTSSDGRWAG